MTKMNKIDSNVAVGKATTTDVKRTEPTSSKKFMGTLSNAEQQAFMDKMRKMIDRIVEQGETLSKRMDIRDLKIYKSLVKEFLEESITNTMQFSKESLLDRRGRHKIIATVKKVNEELEILTNDVLSNEKDNLKILKKLEDIRGLIMDLLI